MNQTNIKRFFGSDWKQTLLNVAIGFLLFFLATFVIAMLGPDVSQWTYGFPFGFLDVDETLPDLAGDVIRPLGFLGDLFFWYLMVCLTRFLFRRSTKA